MKTETITQYQTYERPRFIANQSEGWIYRISDSEVAKIHFFELPVGRTMKLSKMLYESGISVAKPLAWDFVQIPAEFDELKRAFIMEYVPGHSGAELLRLPGIESFKRYDLAKRLADIEIEKARKLGFEPTFEMKNSGNYILTPKNTIKLIDFSSWNHPEVPPLKCVWDGEKTSCLNWVNPEEVFD